MPLGFREMGFGEKPKQILPGQRLLKGRMLRRDMSVSKEESQKPVSAIFAGSRGTVLVES